MIFNTKPYNVGLYNGGTSLVEIFSTDTLVFDGFSLSDGTTMIMTDLRPLGPTRELVGGSIPRGDGEWLTADYWREYVLEAEGIVKKSTAALLDAEIDTIKKNLRLREANLDWTDANGTVKRFVATCDNYDEMFAGRQRYHTTICPWKARFRCKTPFGRSRGYTTTSLAVTTSPTNQSIFNAGTYKAQPVITMIFDSASSVTAASVTNTTTGETISYTGSLAAADALVFDSEAKSVEKNGVAVDYSGSFLTLDVDSNLLQFTITGTSFNAYCTISHRLSYL